MSIMYIAYMTKHINLTSEDLVFDNTTKPLYLQIEELILNLIKSGKFQQGDRLPSISDMAEQLNVNRMTIGRSIRHLAKMGVLKSQRGKGTFIILNHKEYPKITMVSKLTTQLTFSDNAKVQLLHSEKCDGKDCTFIQDDERFDTYQNIIHLNSKFGRPFVYSNLFIASHVFESDPSKFLKKLALRGTVAVVGKANISSITQTMNICAAPKAIAQYLHINVGSPIADVHRYVYDMSNKAVLAGNNIYPGDVIEFKIDLGME